MLERHYGPKYHAWSHDTPTDLAIGEFAKRYGYRPDGAHVSLGLLRIGPVYETRQTPARDLSDGATILHEGAWHSVGAMETDSGTVTVLTSASDIITFGQNQTVTTREG